MAPLFHRTGWPLALLLVALASCHDAPRNNPFDPALTPAVDLQVALDDTAGTATLTWTPYEGQQPFREYQVLRNIADRKSVDTLVHIPAVEQTVFVDTSLAPNTAYVYRVEAVNAGGYAAPSEEKSVAGFSVGAVQLTAVESDPRTGGLVLRWNRYVGPDFAGYQVRRRVGETLREEELAALGEAQDTMFVDTTARADVGYVYRVVVQAAGRELSSDTYETRLLLPSVLLSAPQFDSRTASASLKWTRYKGLRFKAYRVERRTAGLTPLVVQELTELTASAYVDSGLVGNTEYVYQVVVETEREEEVPSEEQRGIFHQLLATWPLEIEEGEYVRLYREGAGITALVVGRQRVRLFLFDAQGALIEEQVLLDNPYLNQPRSVATALGEEGERYVSAAFTRTVTVLGFGADGRLLYRERQVFADSLSALSEADLTVRERVSISNGGNFFFDQVEVSAGGQVLFEEDFEGTPEDWDSIDKNGIVEGRYSGAVATKSDEAWQDFYLEAEMLFGMPGHTESGSGSIEIGTTLEKDNSSFFRFYLDPVAQQVELFWGFIPTPNSSLSSRAKRFTESFFLISGLPYRLGLGFREGQFSASISSPLVWSGNREGDAPWTSLARVGQALILMHGDQVRILSLEGEETGRRALEEQASETRSWKWEGRRGLENRVGFCLPARNQVLFNRILVSPRGEVSWPGGFRILGAGVGQGAGELIFPLSFDTDADGRFFVLDAGNGRIQVFDLEGKYLTQWGRKGSGEGAFDFGNGQGPEDFAGSVAVDSEGYIYVADVGNKRIQKFAP